MEASADIIVEGEMVPPEEVRMNEAFNSFKPRIQALIDDITRDLRAERVSIEIEVQTPSRRVAHSSLNRDNKELN
jgi:hypothetical protein